MSQSVRIISFGYDQPDVFGDLTVPEADMVFDLRRHFRDPHVDPALRNLTGRDSQVISAVTSTRGIRGLETGIVSAVLGYLAGPTALDVTVAVGCVGGRHRSVVVADRVARGLDLRNRFLPVSVVHRDLTKPVLAR
jgi:RNase adaptor protein for sRNA GlmZ degradation